MDNMNPHDARSLLLRLRPPLLLRNGARRATDTTRDDTKIQVDVVVVAPSLREAAKPKSAAKVLTVPPS